jgi:hypothetical protein
MTRRMRFTLRGFSVTRLITRFVSSVFLTVLTCLMSTGCWVL